MEGARTDPQPAPGAGADIAVGTMTRRTFTRLLGAGLLVSVAPLPAFGQRAGGRGAQTLPLSARVHLGRDGTVIILTGKVDGGNGARTELTQAAAEELRLPVGSIHLVMGDTSLCPDDGITAGSRTTPSTVPAVRQGAAAARDVLLRVAGRIWGVPATDLEIRAGKAFHRASGREFSYGDLAAAEGVTADLGEALPANVTLTPVKEWKVLGTSIPRPSARDLVTGTQRFPSDLSQPGMLHGKVLRAPCHGATLKDVDLGRARALPGVVAFRDGGFVGVAAGTSWRAAQALTALEATASWNTTPQPASAEIAGLLRQRAPGGVPTNPFADAVASASKALRQTYQTAYIQHAPLEPRAALAAWEGERLTVWTGTQNPFGTHTELSRALGIPADRVRVVVPDFGGGFGGKHMPDAPLEAARLAKAAGKPVLVRWTRAEEFTWAYCRPAAVIDIEATLDARGMLTSWYFVDINAGGAAIETPYRAGSTKCLSVASDSPLRQGSYRALAATANTFARECFMDELASAAGVGPLEFRLAHLENPRLRAVLEAAAQRFNWSVRVRRRDPALGVGLACGTEKGSCVAACVEVAVQRGEIVVRQVCQVFECGAVLNPEGLRAQVEGCILMGIGPALREEVRCEKGEVLTASFGSYRVPRFSDLPELDIQLLDRPDLPSAGGGETPIVAIAPAIANAVCHATGQRLRQLPLRLKPV